MTHADAANAQIIVATFGMLGEGVSLDFLDTLVVCSQNKTNMNQAFGRILRQRFSFPYAVIDFDDVNFFPGMLRHRLKQYRERLPGTDFQIYRWSKAEGAVDAKPVAFELEPSLVASANKPSRPAPTAPAAATVPTVYKRIRF